MRLQKKAIKDTRMRKPEVKTWRKPHKRTVPLSVAGAGTTSPSDNVALAEAYLRTKWYPNPSSRLATIYRKVGVVCPSTPRHESSSILRKFVCRTLRQIRSVRLCSRTLRLCRAIKSRDFVAGVTWHLHIPRICNVLDGTISVKFFVDVNGWPRYQTA